MAEAGILSLFFGLESLDDERLATLQKGFEYEAIRETLTRAHAAGIRTVGSFIFPTPGETEKSMQTTLAHLRELRPLLDSAVVLPAGVYPPTEWGVHPERYGIASTPRPEGFLVWFHAASVVETNAALPLIAHISKERTDILILLKTSQVT